MPSTLSCFAQTSHHGQTRPSCPAGSPPCPPACYPTAPRCGRCRCRATPSPRTSCGAHRVRTISPGIYHAGHREKQLCSSVCGTGLKRSHVVREGSIRWLARMARLHWPSQHCVRHGCADHSRLPLCKHDGCSRARAWPHGLCLTAACRSRAPLAGFPEYDARRVLRCNKQLEAGVLAHAARTFTEGAEQQQWARWGGAGRGGAGGGPGAAGHR